MILKIARKMNRQPKVYGEERDSMDILEWIYIDGITNVVVGESILVRKGQNRWNEWIIITQDRHHNQPEPRKIFPPVDHMDMARRSADTPTDFSANTIQIFYKDNHNADFMIVGNPTYLLSDDGKTIEKIVG